MGAHGLAAAIMVIIVLGTWSPASAQVSEGSRITAVDAMNQFLIDWIIYSDEDATMAHFGAAAMQVFAPVVTRDDARILTDNRPIPDSTVGNVPARVGGGRRMGGNPDRRSDAWLDEQSNSVRSTYWRILNTIWVSDNKSRYVDGQIQEILAIDDDAYAFVTTELFGKVVHRGLFFVFEAYDDAALHSFDADFGDIAGYLKPSLENPTLILIAGFHAPVFEDAGPFVSFWGQDDDEVWRIQALGAYPKY